MNKFVSTTRISRIWHPGAFAVALNVPAYPGIILAHEHNVGTSCPSTLELELQDDLVGEGQEVE
jgi:hypothetical protein